MAMDISEIRGKYDAGDYYYRRVIPKKVSLDCVFDEELSVRRNRELAIAHNDNIDQMRQENAEKQRELDQKLTSDVIEYITAYYNLNERQARILENFVYQEYHSCMGDYFSYIDTFADLADDLVNAKEDT